MRIFWEKEYPFVSDIDGQEILSLTVDNDLIRVVGKQPPDSLNSMDDRLGISFHTVFYHHPIDFCLLPLLPGCVLFLSYPLFKILYWNSYSSG
ncbi:MAG TPA: hypothetical protein PKW59_01010 [Thermotogota bacterium]|nr:hypothetical protein [Thermotogota bacterium]